MAELIPADTGESGWADFTVSAPPAALFIKGETDGAAPDSLFLLAHKSGSVRTTLRKLDENNIIENGAIGVPGTFSVKRVHADSAAGLDVEGAD